MTDQDLQPPSDEELALLRLLVTGAPDRVVIAKLACSRRSFQRRLGSAMTKLGATSRFQAGAHAAWRQWLIPPDRDG